MIRLGSRKRLGYALASSLGVAGGLLAVTAMSGSAHSAAATGVPHHRAAGGSATGAAAAPAARPAATEAIGAPSSDPGAVPPTTHRAAETPPPTTADSRGAPALPSNAITVRLAGIPATIGAGGPAVEFTATLTNHSSVDASDIAPLFQIVGGPCNCAQGSLQRLDEARGTWEGTAMPEGDGDPNFMAEANGGLDVPAGASVTVHYRLTLTSANPAKPLLARLYAVELPAFTELAGAAVHTQLTAG